MKIQVRSSRNSVTSFFTPFSPKLNDSAIFSLFLAKMLRQSCVRIVVDYTDKDFYLLLLKKWQKKQKR